MKNYHLQFLRLKADLTQKELAQKTGLSASTIQKYEAGTSTPNVYIAMRIAKALDSNVDILFEPTYRKEDGRVKLDERSILGRLGRFG